MLNKKVIIERKKQLLQDHLSAVNQLTNSDTEGSLKQSDEVDMSRQSPILLNKSKASQVAAYRIRNEQSAIRRQQEKHKTKTKKLAQRSQNRLEDWLQDQVTQGSSNRRGGDIQTKRSVSTLATSGPRLNDPLVEKMLTGIYKSSNPNLHEFRRPSGKLTAISKPTDSSIYKDYKEESSRSKLFRGHSGLSASSISQIIKPLDFTVLKGHTVDRERALQSQLRFQKDYIVRGGNSYHVHGPPIKCAGDRQSNLLKECGTGFRTTTKTHDEVSRIKKQQDRNPIMSKQTRSSISNCFSKQDTEEVRASMKNLERNFRKETIKGRSSWSQFKPVNTSQDPYVQDYSSMGFRGRQHHKELSKISPFELQARQKAGKLHKPFESASHRTLEAQIMLGVVKKVPAVGKGAPLRDSLYMFADNDQSLQALHQNSISQGTASEAEAPWIHQKSTEELLKEQQSQAHASAHQSITDRGPGKDPKKVYLKSIEKKIPYNAIARNNISLEKYIELTPSNRIDNQLKVQKASPIASKNEDIILDHQRSQELHESPRMQTENFVIPEEITEDNSPHVRRANRQAKIEPYMRSSNDINQARIKVSQAYGQDSNLVRKASPLAQQQQHGSAAAQDFTLLSGRKSNLQDGGSDFDSRHNSIGQYQSMGQGSSEKKEQRRRLLNNSSNHFNEFSNMSRQQLVKETVNMYFSDPVAAASTVMPQLSLTTQQQSALRQRNKLQKNLSSYKQQHKQAQQQHE